MQKIEVLTKRALHLKGSKLMKAINTIPVISGCCAKV